MRLDVPYPYMHYLPFVPSFYCINHIYYIIMFCFFFFFVCYIYISTSVVCLFYIHLYLLYYSKLNIINYKLRLKGVLSKAGGCSDQTTAECAS